MFDVNSNGLAHKGRLFHNATATESEKEEGKPGGIKTDILGNVYATGPGGVLVLSPEAKLLGKFALDREVTGLAFGTDGRLYMTAGDAVLRKWLKTKPAKKPAEVIQPSRWNIHQGENVWLISNVNGSCGLRIIQILHTLCSLFALDFLC